MNHNSELHPAFESRITMKTFASLFCVTALALVQISDCRANLIVWGAAQDTVSTSDVSANGSLVAAFNGGNVNATVNGTAFVAASPFQFAANSFLGGGNTLDADFNLLLDQNSFNFNNVNPGQGTIDLGSFVAGNTYEVQVFFTDQRSASNNRSVVYGSEDGIGTGATVELLSDPNGDPSTPFGQFAIGTFVADGNDPDLLVTAGVNHNSAQINAWQIRQIASIPEPSGFMLMSLLGICFAFRTRRIS